MRTPSRFWIAFLAAGSLLAAGCRSGEPGKTAALSRQGGVTASLNRALAVRKASQEDLIEAHAHYCTAVIDEMEGRRERALKEYVAAARKDASDEELVLEVSKRLIQANELNQALDLLKHATSWPNASGAIYVRLGFVYSQLGQIKPAVRANREAIRREPHSVLAYQNLCLNYLQQKRTQKALAALDAAAHEPDSSAEFLIRLSELYANLGVQAPNEKQTADARSLAVLERARKLKVATPELRLRLADGFSHLGKQAAAAQIYSALLKDLPDAPLVREAIRAKLAEIYLRGRKTKQAAEQLEAVVRDNPTDPRAYFLLGGIAYDEKHYPQAEQYFGKTVLLKPDYEPGYTYLAYAQLAQNKNQEALKTLGRARQKFRQSFNLEYLSGVACSQQQDYTNALRHFTAAEVVAGATATNRLDAAFYFQVGAASERVGRYAQAADYFEKCLRRSPDFAEALNYLGFMWADRGEHLDRARKLIGKALKLDPQNAAYLDSMGWVLYKLKEPKAALRYIRQAIQFSKEDDATLFDHLGDVYAALGNLEQARHAWQKSLALQPNEKVRKKLESAASE